MATPAELVRGNCELLPAHITALFTELLLAGPASPDGAPVRPSALASSPPPGDAAAFYILNTIWESVFRIEEWLHDETADAWDGYDLISYPRRRRGSSAVNFLDALAAIQKLAAGRDEDVEAAAGRLLEQLNEMARAHPGIDEAQQWRHIRGRACPYCKRLATLKARLDARGRPDGHIECFAVPRANGERCADRDGRRPAAMVGNDSHGRAELQWNDGLRETAPDLEG